MRSYFWWCKSVSTEVIVVSERVVADVFIGEYFSILWFSILFLFYGNSQQDDLEFCFVFGCFNVSCIIFQAIVRLVTCKWWFNENFSIWEHSTCSRDVVQVWWWFIGLLNNVLVVCSRRFCQDFWCHRVILPIFMILEVLFYAVVSYEWKVFCISWWVPF